MICSVVSASENHLFYSLILSYDGGNIQKTKIELLESDITIEPDIGGEYDLILYSKNKEKLYETSFNFHFEKYYEADPSWFDEESNQIFIINESIDTIEENPSIAILIPYYRNGEYIEITQFGKVINKIDVSEYQVCNLDSICDLKESPKLCPEDCQYETEVPKISWLKYFWIWLLQLVRGIF